MNSDVFLRPPSWTRWIMFLPVSAGAYFVVFWGVVLGSKVLDFFSRPGVGGWGANFFELLIAPALAGYYAIAAPMFIAPSQRRAVALTIVAIWMVVYGVLAGAVVFSGSWKVMLAIVTSIAGTLAALVGHSSES